MSLPIGLNRISWKQTAETLLEGLQSLPIGLNRISWKRNTTITKTITSIAPTDWVKSD